MRASVVGFVNWQAWLWRLASLAVIAGILGIWAGVVAAGWVSPVYVPPPARAFERLVHGLMQGDLVALTWATTRRMLYGWALASLIGIALGAAIGSSRILSRLCMPTLELLRPLPASTLLPVGIALFGLTPSMLLGVIAFGSVWPILLATVHGFEAIHPRLREVSELLQTSRLRFALTFGLPAALPDILAGMRISLTAALIVTVVGEMVTAQEGLGMAIMIAGRMFRSPDLYAGIALLGLLGWLSNSLLALAQKKLVPYRPL